MKTWRQRARERDKHSPRSTIVCRRCGATATLRSRKVSPADYYLCGPCDKVEWRRADPVPPGFVRLCQFQAAASFTGYTLRPATEDDLAATERARALVALALHPEGCGDA